MGITQFVSYINSNLASIVAVLVPLEILTVVLLVLFAWRSGRQAERIRKLLKTKDDSNLEDLIADFLAEAESAAKERTELFKELNTLKGTLRSSVQHIGFVRYNAFHGVGGDLSFSIAILDGKLDGFVLTSIFGREEARVYAKLVKEGRAQNALSDEEQAAMLQATGATQDRIGSITAGV